MKALIHVVRIADSCIAKVNGVEVRHYVRHSPTGMEMGYCGSGPADMAYSILRHLFHKPFAERYYQKFKWDFVSGWKGNTVTVEIDFDAWVSYSPADVRVPKVAV